MKSRSVLIRGGHLVTVNSEMDSFVGDLRFCDGRITALAAKLKPEPGEEIIEARGTWVIPGLVQAHTHLVQTLFRGLADDLELLDWLKKRIWPFEAAHNEESLRSSAQIGLLEMQLSGTTSILDMGTVRGHEVIFAEAELSGMRYWGGNCLMDKKAYSGPLYRSTDETLAYCDDLISAWHLKTPLLRYAVSPRFAISCTQKILKSAVRLADDHRLVFHTHASENRSECAMVRDLTGMDNIDYLHSLGVLGSRTVLAHGIHLKEAELKKMVSTQTGLCHCPSSNLKLASGIARIHRYRARGLKVGLGSDGAPCNNQMDAFTEMRLAALLQKPMFGPTALPAREALRLATRGGAEVLNAEKDIGSLEVGKQADIVIVNRTHPSLATVEDPYSALVYSATGRDVRDVWIAGRAIVAGGHHLIYAASDVVTRARAELARLQERLLPS